MDDINRKLTLSVLIKKHNDFMRDTFGRESTKSKGLIDSLSEEEFNPLFETEAKMGRV